MFLWNTQHLCFATFCAFLMIHPPFSAILRSNAYVFCKCQRSLLCWCTYKRVAAGRQKKNHLVSRNGNKCNQPVIIWQKMWIIVCMCINESQACKVAVVGWRWSHEMNLLLCHCCRGSLPLTRRGWHADVTHKQKGFSQCQGTVITSV